MGFQENYSRFYQNLSKFIFQYFSRRFFRRFSGYVTTMKLPVIHTNVHTFFPCDIVRQQVFITVFVKTVPNKGVRVEKSLFCVILIFGSNMCSKCHSIHLYLLNQE